MQWMMLQQDIPKDYVIATGKQITVRDFIIMSAKVLGIQLRFEGKNESEIGIVVNVEGNKAPYIKEGDVIVKIDSRYFRPTEVDSLLGDASKARKELGWKPEIQLKQLCEEMIMNDLNKSMQLSLLKKHGYKINTN